MTKFQFFVIYTTVINMQYNILIKFVIDEINYELGSLLGQSWDEMLLAFTRLSKYDTIPDIGHFNFFYKYHSIYIYDIFIPSNIYGILPNNSIFMTKFTNLKKYLLISIKNRILFKNMEVVFKLKRQIEKKS